jgi:two-component system, OmpR family, sensor histidine kinase MtrB
MVTYTVVASSILVALFGVLVVSRTTSGLLHARIVSAEDQIRAGQNYAQQYLNQLGQHDESSARQTIQTIARNLASPSGEGGPVPAAVLYPPDALGAAGVTPGVSSTATLPQLTVALAGLRPVVSENHLAHQFVSCNVGGTGMRPCLAVGIPVPSRVAGTFQLYYLFPLDAEQTAATVTRNTVIGIGIALVVMLALMAWLVTQMVVRPVRLAARTAQRLSAGLLDQRMEVHGEDDLALLGAAFNQMAVNLQRQIVRLEEMSRLQRRFTSDVSHELRTPLTTVRMAADLFYTSRDELDPMMARTAELLHTELDRFDELMTDLLEISRYDAGFAVLDAEPTDLAPAVHRVVRGLSAVAEQAGVTIDMHVPDAPVIAEVDPRRAERILRNLVGNAIEHSEGRPVVVTVGVDDRAVAVTVRDHGIGLRPGEEKLVFNRFWRADPSRARQTGGSGLGLSISLEDARLHGGWLEAWGAPGQGAQFRLTLPTRAGSKLTESPLTLVPADADVAAVARRYDIVLRIPPDGQVDVALDPAVESGADQSEFEKDRPAEVGAADLVVLEDVDSPSDREQNGGRHTVTEEARSETRDGAPVSAMNGVPARARSHHASATGARGVDASTPERSDND